MSVQSDLESTFAYWVRLIKPDIELHHNYPSAADPHWRAIATGKGYKWDFVHIASRVVIELQGGIYGKGRKRGSHIRPQGYERDCMKMNMAAVNGWQTLYFTSGMIDRDPQGVCDLIERVIQMRMQEKSPI